MSAFVHDVRQAFRVLRRRPYAATIVLLTLALGIGVNTAIFSFLDAILLKPLPYANANRIVGIWERDASGHMSAMSTLNYLDYARQSSVFELVAATTACCTAPMLGGAQSPTPIAAFWVSARYFDVFGAKAAIGRTFVPGEDQQGRDHVVVLSHRFWASRFGSDATLVGRSVRLDDEPYTVIGVMPAGAPFDHMHCDVWLPLSFEPGRINRKFHWLLSFTGGAIGLLKPGVTIEQATAQMDGVATRLSREYPATNQGWGVMLK